MNNVIFELIIRFQNANPITNRHLKESVCAWLVRKGRTDFVEGVVDGVVDSLSDKEHRQATVDEDRMLIAPIALYDRDRSTLIGMMETLRKKFADALDFDIHELPDAAWNDCWRPEFSPWHTTRFLVVPHGFGATEFDHLKLPVINIDARGGAFGTGQHSTTRCLMMMLESHWSSWQPKRILDVGCGTGILSIVAAKLGAQQVSGTEIDRQLVVLARENCATNSVSADIRETANPWDRQAQFDLVIANILVPVLHDLMPQLQQCTRLGGRLLLSGFIAKESGAILAKAQEYGFIKESASDENGWAGVVLIRHH